MRNIFLWRVDSVILNHIRTDGSDSGGFRCKKAAQGLLLRAIYLDGNERGMDVN